jgi:hypothetical protein
MGNFKHYTKGDKKYRRVSTVLNQFYYGPQGDWKAKRKALKIGTIVDGYCEKDWRDGRYKVKKSDPPEVTSCMKGWELWKKHHPEDFNSIKEMQRVHYFDDWGVAGTSDVIMPEVLLDIKTSRKVSKGYWIQTAVYNRDAKKQFVRVLRLDKNFGDYEYVQRPKEYSQEYLEQVFIGMLNVFNYFELGEEKGI